jgi:3-hydroxymyristoyl/3-hydroxydecanoyl-(acyl carrier protein) dehydratase
MKMETALRIAWDHASFEGHFPKFPVLPGAVILDEMLKAIESARGIEVTSWRIASAKFPGLVRPRDTLILEHDAPTPGLIRFTIRVEDRTVASGMLSNAPET